MASIPHACTTDVCADNCSGYFYKDDELTYSKNQVKTVKGVILNGF